MYILVLYALAKIRYYSRYKSNYLLYLRPSKRPTLLEEHSDLERHRELKLYIVHNLFNQVHRRVSD